MSESSRQFERVAERNGQRVQQTKPRGVEIVTSGPDWQGRHGRRPKIEFKLRDNDPPTNPNGRPA
jgi:hypothetical protein